MQGTHRVGRRGGIDIPLFLNSVLQCRQVVGIGLEVGFGTGHADIIHEHGEVSDTEGVHLLIFSHDVVHHRVAVHEVLARVDSPDEVHLSLVRHLAHFADHVLRHPAVLFLFGGKAFRVSVLPLLRVVGVALGTVKIGVHLVAHHEAHQVLLHRNGIGVAVISLHDATALLVGIVVDGDAGQIFRAGVENLFQRSEAVEGGIGVLAQDDNAGPSFCISCEGEDVAVVLAFLCQYRAVQAEGGGLGIGSVGTAVDTQEQIGRTC